MRLQFMQWKFNRETEGLEFDSASEMDPIYQSLSRKRKSNEKIIDLTIANPTVSGFNYSEIMDSQSKFNFYEYAPHPKGLPETREAISEYYQSMGRTVSPENLFLTSGTSEAISYIFKLLCNPGDSVLVPAPGYPLFDFIAELENLEVKRYRLSETIQNDRIEWKLDFAYLEKLLKTKPRILILVQPNNPTGTILNPEEVSHLKKLLHKYKTILVVDEVFSEYIYDKELKLTEFGNTPAFYLNGISKMIGLPQMKLSWFYTKGFGRDTERIHHVLEIITDTFLTVNTPIQKMAPALLKNRDKILLQIRNRVNKNIQYLLDHPDVTIKFHRPVAGWYGILEFPGDRIDEEICLDILDKQNVHFHPGYMFSFEKENYLVFSLLIPESDLQGAWKKLKHPA